MEVKHATNAKAQRYAILSVAQHKPRRSELCDVEVSAGSITAT